MQVRSCRGVFFFFYASDGKWEPQTRQKSDVRLQGGPIFLDGGIVTCTQRQPEEQREGTVEGRLRRNRVVFGASSQVVRTFSRSLVGISGDEGRRKKKGSKEKPSSAIFRRQPQRGASR